MCHRKVIRDRVNLVELLLQFGIDIDLFYDCYVAYCPLPECGAPLFVVDPEYGNTFLCFGCGFQGDGLDFLTDIVGLSCGDALEFLSEEFGIPIEELRGNVCWEARVADTGHWEWEPAIKMKHR